MEKLETELKRARKEFNEEEKQDLEVIAKVLRSDPRYEQHIKKLRARAH